MWSICCRLRLVKKSIWNSSPVFPLLFCHLGACVGLVCAGPGVQQITHVVLSSTAVWLSKRTEHKPYHHQQRRKTFFCPFKFKKADSICSRSVRKQNISNYIRKKMQRNARYLIFSSIY